MRGVCCAVWLLLVCDVRAQTECENNYAPPDYTDQYEQCVGLSGVDYDLCIDFVAGEELVQAASDDDICWVQDVLTRYDVEVDVNQISRGVPALYFATVQLNIDMMQLLLSKGAVLCGESHQHTLKQLDPLAKNYNRAKNLLALQHAKLCAKLSPVSAS